jgi:hypothetical protein
MPRITLVPAGERRVRHARQRRELRSHGGRLRRVHQDFDRGEDAARGAAGADALIGGVRRPRFRQRARARFAGLQFEDRHDQQREHDHRDARRCPASAHHRARPLRPQAAGVTLVADARPVDARADAAQEGRQQRQCHARRDQRDQHPAVAHRAQARDREDDQRDEADRDRQAREHHRAARRRHRDDDRLVVLQAFRALLAPARHDQQRVVDRHPEADQRDQELHDERDVRHVGQREDQQQCRQDRDRRDQQRDEGQQRGEHERQHRQRAETADDRLQEDAGSAARLVFGELLDAGQTDLRAGRQRCRQHLRGVLGRLRRAEVVFLGGVEEGVRRATVGRDQARVVRARIVHDAHAGHVRPHAGEGARELGLLAADRSSRRRAHHHDRGRLVAAVAVGVDDLPRRFIARLARQREVQREALGNVRGAHRARQEDDQPADDHDAAVREHEAREPRDRAALVYPEIATRVHPSLTFS